MNLQTNTLPSVTMNAQGGTPITSPDDIKKVIIENLEAAEKVHAKQAAESWKRTGGEPSAFAALFSAEARANPGKPPSGYRVRSYTYSVSIANLMAAANVSPEKKAAGLAELNQEIMAVNVRATVEEYAKMARAAQPNGAWFLWAVDGNFADRKTQQATVKGRRNVPGAASDWETSVSAGAVPSNFDAGEEDRSVLVQNNVFTFTLHYLDVSGRVDVDDRGQPLRSQTAVGQTEALAGAMKGLGREIAGALKGESVKEEEPAGERLHHKTKEKYEREIAELQAKLAAKGGTP